MKCHLLAIAAIAAPALAQQVVPAQSEISFVSKQMGVPVEGRFRLWTAQIVFDPRKPEAGKVSFTIQTGSASLGAAEADTELSKPAWFNLARFPQASFQSSAIKAPLLGLQNFLIRVEALPYQVVTVLSEGIRDIVFGRNAAVDAIVPLGANLEHFLPREPDPGLRAGFSLAEADFVYAYCGTLDHNRRIGTLVEAFALVAHAEPSARLLILGDGSELEALKQRARALGIADRIRFAGYVPYETIPARLDLCAVALAFVPMDAWFEHQPPTKTVEYLAQGLPVIGTDTAGNRVFLRHEWNGLLCADDARSVSAAMLRVLREPGLREQLATHARASVQRHDWAEIVREHVLPVYERALARKRAARP